MSTIRITLIGLTETDFPGWVDFELMDTLGVAHRFIEKVPVVSGGELRPDEHFPRPGTIACKVVRRWEESDGRQLAMIDTSEPWGIRSETGQEEFLVMAAELER
jgi:hypothetical protein